MKKQINKLIAIAEQYVEIAKKLGFDIDQHNFIRSQYERRSDVYKSTYNIVDSFRSEIKLYFGGEWTSYSLDYGSEVYIIGYKNSVELPFDITTKRLDEIIKDLEEVLISLQKMESKAVEIAKNRKQAEIDILEAKLLKLKEI